MPSFLEGPCECRSAGGPTAGHVCAEANASLLVLACLGQPTSPPPLLVRRQHSAGFGTHCPGPPP
eukprot:3854483-Alexandrium_andersonii.AAC.1